MSHILSGIRVRNGVYRDLKNVQDTAFDEGIEEGVVRTARNLKVLNAPMEMIIEASDLTREEIEKL